MTTSLDSLVWHEASKEDYMAKKASRLKTYKRVGGYNVRVMASYYNFIDPEESCYSLYRKKNGWFELSFVPIIQSNWLVASGLISAKSYKEDLEMSKYKAKRHRAEP